MADRTIWKSTLIPRLIEPQEVAVPRGSEFLCAREQNERICVWYLCDPLAEIEKRVLRVIGTGHTIKDGPGKYLGLVSLDDGRIILHVFEAEPEPDRLGALGINKIVH